MPRNMSFSLTTQMVRCGAKTVTRRIGWHNLRVGEIVNACVKCMGLKPGEKIERICQIRITGNRPEYLRAMLIEPYGSDEAKREGFPAMTGKEFVAMFCEHMRVTPDNVVNRIEFEYLD